MSAQPFVRWCGGKDGMMDQLLPLIPRSWRNYEERFLGGGAMFWRVADRCRGAVRLSDANWNLVVTYGVVRGFVDELIGELHRLASAEPTRENYLLARSLFNSNEVDPVMRGALFIYLNKTCFNALYRVNRRGEFNVNWGKRDHSAVLDESNLRACSAALQQAEITNSDWRLVLETAEPGDFVYLDPPYVPESETASFTSYTEKGFSEQEQEELARAFRELTRRGVQVMLSNSDTPLVHRLYRGFQIDTVLRGGNMNSDPTQRQAVPELVIRGGYQS